MVSVSSSLELPNVLFGTGVSWFPDPATGSLVGSKSPADGADVNDRMGLGDSGEKEGKLVRDLSDAAMELAELETCEASRLSRPRTLIERLLLLTEVVLCWEAERSRDMEDGERFIFARVGAGRERWPQAS